MSDIYLDPSTHDIDFQSGAMRLTESNLELARQSTEIALKAYRGEWFANIDFGMPYLINSNNSINLLGKPREELVNSYGREVVLDVPEVVGIIDFTSTFDRASSEYEISAEIVTTEGTATVSIGG